MDLYLSDIASRYFQWSVEDLRTGNHMHSNCDRYKIYQEKLWLHNKLSYFDRIIYLIEYMD